MILNRIKRGAARTSFLAQKKIVNVKAPRLLMFTTRSVERAVLSTMALRVALIPVPVSAAQAVGPVEAEPPSTTRISHLVADALSFDKVGGTISVALPSLPGIHVGESIDALQQAQAAQQATADAAAKAAADEAAAKALLLASEQAAHASTQQTIVASFASVDSDAVRQMIRDAAARYGATDYQAKVAISIAQCESGFDQYSKNANSSARGVYQFLTSTWYSNANPGQNVFNAYDNVDVAMRKLTGNGSGIWDTSAWNSSKFCWGGPQE
jgi:Transglycosylase-like domain